MPRRETVLVICSFCLLLCLGCAERTQSLPSRCVRQTDPAPALPSTGTALRLDGAGLGQPQAFTFAQLRALPFKRLDNVPMSRSHAPDEVTSWRGPELAALLEAAEIKAGPMMLMVAAQDGYRIAGTRAELRSAVVALQDGRGRWLSDLDETCPIRLVVPDKPGNYWVQNVWRITVEPQGDS
ncbi:MAG: molybdopterin-dependent oxidoreductase [Planctomycetes bacterium]|nr:molybdopterin-dependent oxidoreductase [Planctomycetota bacterium]